jgi:hypothetical protein
MKCGIASARVRSGLIGPARWLCTFQRCDVFGPWPDASVYQIWVTDASARTGALSARVLPRGSRPHLAAAQRTRAMLGAPPHRFVLCCGIGSLLRPPTNGDVTSMPTLGPPRRHPMPSCLFKSAVPGQSSTPMLPSPFFSTVVLHTTAGRR